MNKYGLRKHEFLRAQSRVPCTSPGVMWTCHKAHLHLLYYCQDWCRILHRPLEAKSRGSKLCKSIIAQLVSVFSMFAMFTILWSGHCPPETTKISVFPTDLAVKHFVCVLSNTNVLGCFTISCFFLLMWASIISCCGIQVLAVQVGNRTRQLLPDKWVSPLHSGSKFSLLHLQPNAN